jgi:hypothetical protein
MYKIIRILTILSIVLASGQSFAKKKRRVKKMRKTASYSRNYGMAGCGLGSLVVQKNGNQISAGTTNGTSYNQVFGITFGTSNCTDGPMDEVALNMDKFININKVNMAADISKGEGETINAVAEMMGCTDRNKLAKTLQDNFSSIYPNAKVNAMQITDSVISTIAEDQNLKGSCSKAALI